MTSQFLKAAALAVVVGLAGNALADQNNKDKGSCEAQAGCDVKTETVSMENKEGKTAQQASANIVQTAQSAGNFNTLLAAVKAAGLAETLSGGSFTVFAPTDEAFAKLPKETLESLLKPENKDKLKAILTYHVLAGETMSCCVEKNATVKKDTVNGKSIEIKNTDGKISINNAQVVKADIKTSNGYVHVIDTVILPPEG